MATKEKKAKSISEIRPGTNLDKVHQVLLENAGTYISKAFIIAACDPNWKKAVVASALGGLKREYKLNIRSEYIEDIWRYKYTPYVPVAEETEEYKQELAKKVPAVEREPDEVLFKPPTLEEELKDAYPAPESLPRNGTPGIGKSSEVSEILNTATFGTPEEILDPVKEVTDEQIQDCLYLIIRKKRVSANTIMEHFDVDLDTAVKIMQKTAQVHSEILKHYLVLRDDGRHY